MLTLHEGRVVKRYLVFCIKRNKAEVRVEAKVVGQISELKLTVISKVEEKVFRWRCIGQLLYHPYLGIVIHHRSGSHLKL